MAFKVVLAFVCVLLSTTFGCVLFQGNFNSDHEVWGSLWDNRDPQSSDPTCTLIFAKNDLGLYLLEYQRAVIISGPGCFYQT
jgi:hypothetical protein